MKVHVEILNTNSEPRFKSVGIVSVEDLFDLGETRQKKTLENGINWSAGLVSFLASKLIKAVDSGAHNEIIRTTTHDLLLASWLFDSVFCGITAYDYMNADIHFVITKDSRVSRSLTPNAVN